MQRYAEITPGELPEALRLLVEHQAPVGAMFPVDWNEMMALAFWSALVPPAARVENLGLNLWFLGINPQGVGKNITSDELYRVTRTVLALQEREIALFTSGSAEGMGRRLQGSGNTLLAYHAEYAGFLKSLKQMPGGKEMLCNLYDGRDVSHQLAGERIEATDPYVVVVATTTTTAIETSGDRGDLQNGYLSRFLFCAPDSLDIGPTRFPTERERYALAERLTEILGAAGEAPQLTISPGAAVVLDEYKALVGMHTGRLRNLDQERANEETPPGRLIARVKKIAGLCALADSRTTIGPRDMDLAIGFVGRGNAYQLRVARWVGASRDDVLTEKVLYQLRRKREPLTARELRQLVNGSTGREIQETVNGLIEDGVLEAVPSLHGGTTRYALVKKG